MEVLGAMPLRSLPQITEEADAMATLRSWIFRSGLRVTRSLEIRREAVFGLTSTMRESGKGEVLAHWRKCTSLEQSVLYTEPFDFDQPEGHR